MRRTPNYAHTKPVKMFMLSTITDVVPIHPSEFGKRTRQVIEDSINVKYADRVVHKVGLFICFYDLLNAGDGLIDSGASNGTVFVHGVCALNFFFLLS